MSDAAKVFMGEVSSKQIPQNIEEAMLDEHWKMVVYDEMKALQENNTWKLPTLLDGKKTVVGCKWVFTMKYKANETVERYKARLVAKGNTIRILLSPAANLD